ncbi:hypothetical protein VTH06DRAFT_5686 [Thermothelomyces fergusii]
MPPPPPSSTLRPAGEKQPASYQLAKTAHSFILPQKSSSREQPSAGIVTTSTTAAGKTTARITTPATACPAAAAVNATLRSRHPSRLRDQNATSEPQTVKPRSETATSLLTTKARMPSYERPSVAGHRQPTVGRAGSKPPLTPKIAARTATPQHQAPTLAATPLARRSADLSSLGVYANGSRDRDEPASPVPAFLSNNVTPRSGSRQGRIDSANSTPNGTPNPDRHDPLETRSSLANAGADDAQRRPVVTLSSPSDAGSGIRQDRDSKFFYASDAQKLASQPPTTRPAAPHQAKPATFFYANGSTLSEQENGPPRPFSPPLASPPPQDGLESRFFYASGSTGLQPPAKIGPSTRKSSGSVVSTASKAPTSRLSNGPRTVSPVKSPQQTAPRNASSGTIALRSPAAPVGLQPINPLNQGKVDIEAPCRPRSQIYIKSSAAIEQPITTKRLSVQGSLPSLPSLPSSGDTSPLLSPQPGFAPPNPVNAGLASTSQAAEDLAGSDVDPTKTSQEAQVTDLVANARRERKVQDLEITNASLEAINRTLERQLRKQTAELRRYQRLSRSGFLSFGSLGSQIPSDSAAQEGNGTGSSDLRDEQGENEIEKTEPEELERLDDEDELSSSEVSEEASAPATELPPEKRRRDERRLALDLSKHRQLLIDSQKINQSLKRCLGWTEELIKEGKRALEYQVRATDVELGGRVLAPEEVERRERGDDETEDSILDEDAIYAIDALGGGSLADADTSATCSTKDPQDRDSGIALPADGG